MTAVDLLGRELQETWLREIPLASALAIEVASCTREEILVRAPLTPNRNLHGTAFAGSLFAVCVLTGWGAAWRALKARSAEGLIVVADVSMSLDNVLAIAGVARSNLWVLVVGLTLSVVFMGLAAALIARVLNRHTWIGYVGLAVIFYVAIRMIIDGAHEVLAAMS